MIDFTLTETQKILKRDRRLERVLRKPGLANIFSVHDYLLMVVRPLGSSDEKDVFIGSGERKFMGGSSECDRFHAGWRHSNMGFSSGSFQFTPFCRIKTKRFGGSYADGFILIEESTNQRVDSTLISQFS